MPSTDTREDFARTYSSFEIPLANISNPSAANTVAAADLDADGTIAGEAELEKTYDLLSQLPGGQKNGLNTQDTNSQRAAAFASLCGAMQQTTGEDGPLGNGSLFEASPALEAIGAGVQGTCLRPIKGRKTQGTGPVQEALNYIAQHHAANDGAASRYAVGAADSYYGNKTQTAIEAVQRANSLPQTGIVDHATLIALNAALKAARAAPTPSPVPPHTDLKIISGNTRFGNKVAFTFDDGPNPTHTPRVLAKLDHLGLKAIFFVNGDNGGNGAAHHADLICEIVRRGHIIGNHTNHHKNLTKLDENEIREEIRSVQSYVDKALRDGGIIGPNQNYQMKVGRPPFGAMNDTVKRIFAEEGLIVVMWNMDSNDWTAEVRGNSELAIQNVLNDLRDGTGGIVLEHDIQHDFEDVGDQMCEKIRDRGFTIINAGAIINTVCPGAFDEALV
jgi:peptidoglycan/xylan/chitin deacetylase (PgdA/CDA1 family)